MSLDCTTTRQYLSPYLDAEIDAEQRQAVQEHLDACDACRAELAALRETGHVLQAWQVAAVDPQLSVRFAARLADHTRPHRSVFRRVSAWATGGAVVLVALSWSLHGLLLPPAPREVPPVTSRQVTPVPAREYGKRDQNARARAFNEPALAEGRNVVVHANSARGVRRASVMPRRDDLTADTALVAINALAETPASSLAATPGEPVDTDGATALSPDCVVASVWAETD